VEAEHCSLPEIPRRLQITCASGQGVQELAVPKAIALPLEREQGQPLTLAVPARQVRDQRCSVERRVLESTRGAGDRVPLEESGRREQPVHLPKIAVVEVDDEPHDNAPYFLRRALAPGYGDVVGGPSRALSRGADTHGGDKGGGSQYTSPDPHHVTRMLGRKSFHASPQEALTNAGVGEIARTRGSDYNVCMARRIAVAVSLVCAAAALALFAGGSFATASHAAASAELPGLSKSQLPAPFAGVRWAGLEYPGLAWCRGFTPRLIVERTTLIQVSGHATPIALVMVTCNLNHLYANLYAFTSSPDPKRPRLLQRLANQDRQQPIGLSTSRDRVVLKVAGYTKTEGFCCPTADVVKSWRWNGSHFRALPTVPITSIVIPKVVGMSFDKASDVLAAAGIVTFDWHQRGNQTAPEHRLVVVATSPGGGTEIHPPNFHVTVTTAPR
jgi:hypothetical protein